MLNRVTLPQFIALMPVGCANGSAGARKARRPLGLASLRSDTCSFRCRRALHAASIDTSPVEPFEQGFELRL